MSDLDPDYDVCPIYCDDAELRPSRQCADCPAREAREKFESECEFFLKKRVFRGKPSRWSIKHLVACVDFAASVESGIPEGTVKDDWTVGLARMIAIVKSERWRAKRFDEWNEKQKDKEGQDV